MYTAEREDTRPPYKQWDKERLPWLLSFSLSRALYRPHECARGKSLSEIGTTRLLLLLHSRYLFRSVWLRCACVQNETRSRPRERHGRYCSKVVTAPGQERVYVRQGGDPSISSFFLFLLLLWLFFFLCCSFGDSLSGCTSLFLRSDIF